MARGVYIRKNGGLYPADLDAERFMAGVKEGAYVTVDAKRPRNADSLREFAR